LDLKHLAGFGTNNSTIAHILILALLTTVVESSPFAIDFL